MAKVEDGRTTPRRRFRIPEETEKAVLEHCELIRVPTGGDRADRPAGDRAQYFGEWMLEAARVSLRVPDLVDDLKEIAELLAPDNLEPIGARAIVEHLISRLEKDPDTC